jgi:acyl-CoA reductase-like NAD-dependent aldehyde dehydrogenase
MRIINPANESLISEIPDDSRDSVEAKYRLLKEGQQDWARVPLDERIACIDRFSRLLDEESKELAATLTQEMGKPLKQSLNELQGARERIRFFAEHSARWLSEEWIIREAPTQEKISFDPLGVVANISAWNYPYLVGVNVFVPALLGGNALLYKPSEYASLTGLHLGRLLEAAGIPRNCFQVVIGGAAAGQFLLDLPLNGYFFTGSHKTGQYLARAIAGRMVPCQLELGGKDPLYVMDDVEDLEKTAAAVWEGVVYNNGQSCCAVERVYAQEGIFDRFVNCMAAQARQMSIGDPMEPSTDIGPLSRKAQVDFLLRQIGQAVTEGARILAGGKALPGPGYWIQPTILIDVNQEMNIMREESFGPVIGVQKVKDDQEAVERMLDTEYGLTAAVYSKNFERAEAVMRQMNTGTVYWNCCDRVSASLPWSGRKHSGMGTTLSYQGIRAFVQPKAWHIRPH